MFHVERRTNRPIHAEAAHLSDHPQTPSGNRESALASDALWAATAGVMASSPRSPPCTSTGSRR